MDVSASTTQNTPNGVYALKKAMDVEQQGVERMLQDQQQQTQKLQQQQQQQMQQQEQQVVAQKTGLGLGLDITA